MKINDDATWEKVKEWKLKGFSVQGYFLEKAGEQKDDISDDRVFLEKAG